MNDLTKVNIGMERMAYQFTMMGIMDVNRSNPMCTYV